jgi:hypothetical protein
VKHLIYPIAILALWAAFPRAAAMGPPVCKCPLNVFHTEVGCHVGNWQGDAGQTQCCQSCGTQCETCNLEQLTCCNKPFNPPIYTAVDGNPLSCETRADTLSGRLENGELVWERVAKCAPIQQRHGMDRPEIDK